MKKYIFAAIFALAASAAASAETSYALLVNTIDGNSIEYDFEYLPIATFEGDEMIISDDRGAGTARYAIEDVLNMTIKPAASGVDDVVEAGRIKVRTEGGFMIVSGLEGAAKVNVFDASGNAVASAVADPSGIASIDTSALGKGVYVVAMPNHSFKFIR